MAETSTLVLLTACVSICVSMLHGLMGAGCDRTILYVLFVLRSHFLYDLTSIASLGAPADARSRRQSHEALEGHIGIRHGVVSCLVTLALQLQHVDFCKGYWWLPSHNSVGQCRNHRCSASRDGVPLFPTSGALYFASSRCSSPLKVIVCTRVLVIPEYHQCFI